MANSFNSDFSQIRALPIFSFSSGFRGGSMESYVKSGLRGHGKDLVPIPHQFTLALTQ